jgi:hypothetical protein
MKKKAAADRRNAWDTGSPPPPSVPARQQLAALKRHDPAFSIGVLEDFLAGLFARVHDARGRGALDDVGAWLNANSRAALQSRAGEGAVAGIVVGAVRFLRYSEHAGHATIVVDFDAVWNAGGQAHEVVERWTLSRALTAKSRTPESARAFPCNACGAPLSSLRGNRCDSCGTIVNTGAVDWVVVGAKVVSTTRRSVDVVAGHVDEAGTDRPTVFDPDRGIALAALCKRDPAFEPGALQRRIRLIFEQLQDAWSNQRWRSARAFVTDEIFQSFQAQLDEYARQGLRNQTKNARVTRIEIVRVDQDDFFDAVTVRLFATGADFTTDRSGRVVSGSATQMRPYSEYWTLIRSAITTGPASTEVSCPQCRAPLQIAHTGACEFCNAKVSSGQFDWVLSRIEQDDVYGT